METRGSPHRDVVLSRVVLPGEPEVRRRSSRNQSVRTRLDLRVGNRYSELGREIDNVRQDRQRKLLTAPKNLHDGLAEIPEVVAQSRSEIGERSIEGVKALQRVRRLGSRTSRPRVLC